MSAWLIFLTFQTTVLCSNTEVYAPTTKRIWVISHRFHAFFMTESHFTVHFRIRCECWNSLYNITLNSWGFSPPKKKLTVLLRPNSSPCIIAKHITLQSIWSSNCTWLLVIVETVFYPDDKFIFVGLNHKWNIWFRSFFLIFLIICTGSTVGN